MGPGEVGPDETEENVLEGSAESIARSVTVSDSDLCTLDPGESPDGLNQAGLSETFLTIY